MFLIDCPAKVFVTIQQFFLCVLYSNVPLVRTSSPFLMGAEWRIWKITLTREWKILNKNKQGDFIEGIILKRGDR